MRSDVTSNMFIRKVATANFCQLKHKASQKTAVCVAKIILT